jgi:hypothetical protein
LAQPQPAFGSEHYGARRAPGSVCYLRQLHTGPRGHWLSECLGPKVPGVVP